MIGILNLFKPCGPTSRDCINPIQRLLRTVKVGHAGTLDPMASGVLLVLVGNAVRLTDEIHELDKEYVGDFELGLSSVSGDNQYEVVPHIHNNLNLTENDLRCAAANFLGRIEQTPPAFSAIRIGGERAYDLARRGEDVAMPSRQVSIHELELLEYTHPHMKLRIVCSTGTYIRSLGRDIARSLGSDAVMTNLIRTRIGPFLASDSCSIPTLDSPQSIEQSLIPPGNGLAHLPSIVLPNETIERFRVGKVSQLPLESTAPHSRLALFNSQKHLMGIIQFDAAKQGWKTEKFLAVQV